MNPMVDALDQVDMLPGQKSPQESKISSEAQSSLVEILDAMADGFAFFDANDRLVMANQKYSEFFSHVADKIVPGVQFESLVRHEVESKQFGGTFGSDEEFIRWRLQAHNNPGEPHTVLLDDGRFIQISERRTSDGGIVSIYSDVTELKQREERLTALSGDLQARNMHFDTALNNMVQGLSMFDADQRMIVCNNRYLEMYGFSPDVVKPGISLREIMEYSVSIGNYSREEAQRALSERPVHAASRERSTIYQHLKDGRVLAVMHQPMPSGGSVATYEDITELVRREEELESMSRELSSKALHFDTALNNMVQGLCMFDADQRLIVWNRRYLELYGFDPEHIKPGMSLREIMEYSVSLGNYGDQDAQQAVQERPMHAAMRKRVTLHQRLADGRVIAVMHQPMSDGGSVATYEDITARVHAEEMLHEYASKLERSNKELEDFAFVASHDLQEPLRKIEAFGDRLKRKCGESLSEDGNLYLDRMQDAARRMRVLITDLLSYSRVTTKAKPFESVDLKKVANEVVSDLQIRLQESGGAVEVGDLPTIQADPTQMRQLMQNLISNALKFQREGVPPVVEVSGQVLQLEKDETNWPPQTVERCEIVIKDNGIGFEQKYAERIFAVFQRLHGRSEYEGTGIGLATCRKIADRHDGEIRAEGRPDEGATFTISLPVRQKSVEKDDEAND